MKAIAVIQTILLAAIAALILLPLVHRQIAGQVAGGEDYREFTFDGHATFRGADGGAREVAVIFMDYSMANGTNSAAELKTTESRPHFEFDGAGLLEEVGADGWELAWTDGTRYIVRRPAGKWKHDSFIVEYRNPSAR